MRGIALGTLLALAHVGAHAESPPEDRIVAVIGQVGDWGTEPADWFRLTGLDAKLLIPSGEERDTHWDMIEAAQARGISLRVRIDAAGWLAPSGDHIVYRVCSIGLRTAPGFGDEARNCPPAPPPGKPHERLLALGVAAAEAEERPELARRLLTAALAARPGLPPLAQALAHRARGEAAETLAADFGPTAAEHDRLMADALADYRRLAELLPDRPALLLSVGLAFQALGGYDEALQLYREVGRRSPGHAFEVAVQIGLLYRQQGNYARALEVLDEFAREAGPLEYGMKFHYHRAWTLTLLGRDEEALEHLDAGLATQPDYTGALQLRSCARARLGQLEAALADQRRALELFTASDVASAWLRETVAHSRRAEAALETAIAEGRRETVTAPCENLWDRWQQPRQRSSMLPPAG